MKVMASCTQRGVKFELLELQHCSEMSRAL
jgi:hypothetical protein